MSGAVREQHLASMRAELADLDKRLSSARSAAELARAEADLLASQYSELHGLIRELEGAKALGAGGP